MVYAGSLQVLHFDDLYGPPQDKICLTVCLEPSVMFFLISRHISPFKLERPELKERQVLIDLANHDFILKQDSYINCTEPFAKHIDDVRALLTGPEYQIRGNASQEVINNVIEAVDDSPTISLRVQGFILDTLRPLTEYRA